MPPAGRTNPLRTRWGHGRGTMTGNHSTPRGKPIRILNENLCRACLDSDRKPTERGSVGVSIHTGVRTSEFGANRHPTRRRAVCIAVAHDEAHDGRFWSECGGHPLDDFEASAPTGETS